VVTGYFSLIEFGSEEERWQ